MFVGAASGAMTHAQKRNWFKELGSSSSQYTKSIDQVTTEEGLRTLSDHGPPRTPGIATLGPGPRLALATEATGDKTSVDW